MLGKIRGLMWESSAKIEARSFLRALQAFHKLRDEFMLIMANYAIRLRQVASLPDGAAKGSAGEGSPSFPFRLLAGAEKIIKYIRLIPAFISQQRKLDRLRKIQSRPDGLIIATASNRLRGPLLAQAGPRKYFSLLTRDLRQGVHPAGVDLEVDEARNLFICEPLIESPLWVIKDKCWEDRVFILDGSYVLFHGLLAVLALRASCVRHGLAQWKYYRSLRQGAASPLTTFKEILSGAILFEGYRRIFGGCDALRAYFLTTNSFVTEILRFYLLIDTRCKFACEIMHGIPTTLYERYLRNMFEACSEHAAAQKHCSIAQLPDLPMFGILASDVKCHPGTAINTYLNRYWFERGKDAADLGAAIAGEFRAAFGDNGRITEDTLIITFFGGSSEQRDVFRSESFKVECFILRQVKELMDDLKRPYVIIYTPHPVYSATNFRDHEFFVQNGIVIYPDTVLTWFISDLCLALFSSALFEAAYFGVHAFTPTVVVDDMFPGRLLELLGHPKEGSGSSLVVDLRRFLLRHANRPSVDLMTRIKERARKYSPTADAGGIC